MNLTGNTEYGVRIFHAASINEPVNVLLDDREVVRGLNYKTVTDYLPLANKQYNIKIYGTNTGRLLYNQTVNIDSHKFITLSAVNENGKLDLVVLEDSDTYYRSKDNKRNIRKKVLDCYNNFIDIIVNESGEVIEDVNDKYGYNMIKSGDEIKKIVDRFGNVVEVVVNNYGEIIAFIDETVTNNLMIRIGDVIEKTVDEFGNEVYVVIDEFGSVVGWVIEEDNNKCNIEIKDNSSTLIPPLNRFENQNTAYIRVVHLSPQAPAIDTTLMDDTILFVDTKYKQVTDYKKIGIGTNILQLRPTGSNQVVLTVPNINLIPNKYYTLYVIGELNGVPPLEAILLRDGSY